MTSTTINEQVTKHFEVELEVETSSAYFKPNPGKVYLIKIDPQRDKIVPIQNALSNNILENKLVSDTKWQSLPVGVVGYHWILLILPAKSNENQFATIIRRGGEM